MSVTEEVSATSLAPLPATARAESAGDSFMSCTHCGLPVPRGFREEGAGPQFCCAGCRVAFSILTSASLEHYYELSERRGVAVTPSGRSYEEFDHPAFHALHVRSLGNGLASTELYLEGIHCASCVWLVERMPLLLPGVVRAELNFRRALARIEWNPREVSLSSIARRLDSLGYAAHPFRGARREDLRRAEDRTMLGRIGVSGAIAINVMLVSVALYSGWLGAMESEWEQFFRWAAFLLVTPTLLFPGRVFFASALAALRARTPNMDIPIALGLAAGYLHGTWNTLAGRGPIYFDGLALLVFALLVGRYLQLRGQRGAADSAELLLAVTPSNARIVDDDGATRTVPAAALLPGMQLHVRSGETFAADGIVDDGESAVDNSLLTGESRPLRVARGDRVWAGTLNLSAALLVRVTEAGETSRVAKLMLQVEESAQRRAPVVLLANRMAARFVVIVLLLALATTVAWLFIDPARAIQNGIALLIVTCPCALALSTPLAVSVAIGRAAKNGILIKGGDVLESLARPALLLLDKTGTLTEARASVVHFEGPDWVKPMILAVEAESSHPIADAFRRSWPEENVARAARVAYSAGGGLEGDVGEQRFVVGSPAFVAARCETRTSEVEDNLPLTRVDVGVGGKIMASAWIGDQLRADSAIAVAQLVQRGWRLGIVSGDSAPVVQAVARDLAIPIADCVAEASPEAKVAVVERELRNSHGGTVVVVGDGVNDAAAMSAATVGIGVHGGAEACLQTADVFLTRPGLGPLVELMDGARRTMRVIKRNIALSIIYNIVGAALAMTGVLTPLIAAVLMPASSITVVLASWRSRTFVERAK